MVNNYFLSLGSYPVDTRGDVCLYPHDSIHPDGPSSIQWTKKQPRGYWIISKGIYLYGRLLGLSLLKIHWILTERMTGRIYLAVGTWLVEGHGRVKPNFSGVMSPPLMSQRVKPLHFFKFNLILTISPTTTSYTYNQLLVTDALLRMPDLLA